jgi:hypothetical protein
VRHRFTEQRSVTDNPSSLASTFLRRGEWHTFPLVGLVPDHAKARIASAYLDAFKVTKLQARYPDRALHSFGFYDGSFAYETLDGEANGGVVNQDYFFWPMIQQQGHGSFWRAHPMGGETRPVRYGPILVTT